MYNSDIILALDGVCRLCLTVTEKTDLVDIFDTNGLSLQIMGCVSVEVNPQDSLPHQICLNCRYHLERTRWFRKACQKSAAKLKRFEKCFNNGTAKKLTDISDDEEDRDEDLDMKFIEEYEKWRFGGGGAITSNVFALQEDQDIINVIQEEEGIEETEEVNAEIVYYYEDTVDIEENKEVVTTQIPTVRKQTIGQKRKRGNFSVDTKVLTEYKCEECETAFSSNKDMAQHMKTTHNLTPGFLKLSCDYCPKWFQTQKGKDKHMVIHTEERPFECGECNRTFSQKVYLDRHMGTHTGEKQFRSKSEAWNFFRRFPANLDEPAIAGICNRCERRVRTNKSGYSNLMRHYEVCHSREISRPPLLSCFVSNTAASSTSPPPTSNMQRTKTPKQDPLVIKVPVEMPPSPAKGIHKASCPTVSASVRQRISEEWLRATCDTYSAFSVIDNPRMRWILQQIPGYEPPSSAVLKSTMLDKMADFRRREIVSQLEAAEYVSISTESWTCVRKNHYIGVTAHFLTSKMKPCGVALDCIPYKEDGTGNNIANALTKLFSDWKIDEKVIAITTDNTATMGEAVQLLKVDHIPCIAHTLNSAVQSALEEPFVNSLMAQIHTLAVEFRRGGPQKELLANQERMGLPILVMKLDCPTRWNSSYEMIERAIECWEPLSSALVKYPEYEKHLPTEHVEDVEDLCTILKPFKEVTDVLSSETKPVISEVFMILTGLRKKFEEASSKIGINRDIRAFIDELAHELHTNPQLAAIEKNPKVVRACLLDPRFKTFGLSDLASRAGQKALRNAVERLYDMEEPTSSSSKTTSMNCPSWMLDHVTIKIDTVGSNTNKSIIETDRYFKEMPLDVTGDPLEWWNENGHKYKMLHKLAQEVLCIMPTSVPSDSSFTKAGNTLKSRRRLTGEELTKMMLLSKPC